MIVEILSTVFWLLIALTVLVFVHEMGHFLAAKLFGMRVDRFSIGFPPIIFGKQWGDTEYVIGATPLGGYVKIAGMVDESMDTDFIEQEPKPYEFRAKPVWQRIVVITAGVIFNVILAAIIFAGLKMAYGEAYVPAENVEEIRVAEGSLAYEMGLRSGDRITAVNGRAPERASQLQLGGAEAMLADSLKITVRRGSGEAQEEHVFTAPPDIMTRSTQAVRSGEGLGVSIALPPILGGVAEDSPAAEAGLQEGDRITAINGAPVRAWQDLTEVVGGAGGQPLAVRWTRSGEGSAADAGGSFEAQVTPRYDSTLGRALLGVRSPSPSVLGVQRISYGPGAALVAGVRQTGQVTGQIVESFRRLFTGRDSFRTNVGGPVEIARVTKAAADRGADAFWRIVAFLSVTLAVMNILPIPALDGGHLMFLLYEGITRRRPSEKVRMVMQQIGFAVLIVFMAFVIFNDILRL